MKTSEVWVRHTGIGYLVLKSGSSKQVQWELELLRDGSIRSGCIRGDEKHLQAAVDDGCAILRFSPNMSAAITIYHYEHREASFTTLLVSSTPPLFRAQTIPSSGTILDGDQFSIEFASADGESLVVIVPTVVMRDYLPILEKQVPRRSTTSAPTAFFQLPETWATAAPASYAFVCLKFNDEPPWGLRPDEARQLAAELIELAENVETRSAIVN